MMSSWTIIETYVGCHCAQCEWPTSAYAICIKSWMCSKCPSYHLVPHHLPGNSDRAWEFLPWHPMHSFMGPMLPQGECYRKRVRASVLRLDSAGGYLQVACKTTSCSGLDLLIVSPYSLGQHSGGSGLIPKNRWIGSMLGLICAGRGVAFALAKAGRKQRAADRKVMPEATGDIREIVGQPVFLPLFKLFTIYGKIFRLSFGPKSFVIISDAQLAKKVSEAIADHQQFPLGMEGSATRTLATRTSARMPGHCCASVQNHPIPTPF